MKHRLFIIFMFAGCMNLAAQSVGINNNNPHPSAVLDIVSTSQGVLIPRMTVTQRNAIVAPAPGLQIINTTDDCLEIYFSGAGWKKVTCNCVGAPGSPTIQGNASVCLNQQGVAYTVTPVPGAVSYTWTVPNGATVASGQGTSNITVNFGTASGAITCMAVNFCGNSTPTTFSVTAANPSSAFTYTPAQPSINLNATFTATQGGLTYAWTFQSASPATSVNQSQAVVWSQTGNYSVKLKTTNQAGCSDSTTQSVTVINCPPGTQTFTANGTNATGSIQNFTVPQCVTSLTIEAWGAQGGNSSPQIGGLGAYIKGTVSVNGGEVLKILVGQQAPAYTCAAGGGGGSFVARQNNTPLVVAGGGSGATCNSAGLPGQSGNNGADGMNCGGTGGTNGNGGGSAVNCNQGTGGGGGFYTDGASNSSYGSQRGFAFVNGGNGGSSSTGNAVGGYGGGCGTHTNNTGGGPGGGYSGGGAPYHGNGYSGGGGGSYNAGTNQTNTSGVRTGNGQVIITW